MPDPHKTRSKFLSLVLRHQPEEAGIILDEAGWVAVDELLAGCRRSGHAITPDQLREIVRTSDKQRFALSDDGTRIRANQGHSVEVDLGYEPAAPPGVLYHGTAERYLPSIRREGLSKGARHHVHLSQTVATATAVGRRHGKVVVLEVRAGDMHRSGLAFFRTPNGVWLTDSVPAGKTRYCTSCYTGVYPVAFPRDEAAYLQLALKLNPESVSPSAPRPVAASGFEAEDLPGAAGPSLAGAGSSRGGRRSE